MTDAKDGFFPTAAELSSAVLDFCNGLDDVVRLQELGGWLVQPNEVLESLPLPEGSEHSRLWPDSVVIKSKWGDGPWILEPDLVIFRAKAEPHLRCMAWRHPMFGQLNGYVLLPPSLFIWQLSPDAIKEIPTEGSHRGLTYAEPSEGGNWIVGFHTGHAFDYQPALESRAPRWLRRAEVPLCFRGTYRDLPYVRAELELLAADLGKAAAR